MASNEKRRGSTQPAVGKRNEQPKDQSQVAFLRALKGQEVLAAFLDGKALRGVLTNFDAYTVFLRQRSGLEIAVFKPSLKYLPRAPAEGGK